MPNRLASCSCRQLTAEPEGLEAFIAIPVGAEHIP